MKKILVTGGAGFIGSHLCKRLLKEGNEVPSGQASVLSFKKESLFEILGMEQGGEWKVKGDTLQINTQTVDKFLIIQLDESILHTKGLGTDTIDYFFKKIK